jgi:hypothetical protein
LIDRITDEYVMGEWKMRSSDYKLNHGPQDVDVLVCWVDDEQQRALLSATVISLQEVARTVASENIGQT